MRRSQLGRSSSGRPASAHSAPSAARRDRTRTRSHPAGELPGRSTKPARCRIFRSPSARLAVHVRSCSNSPQVTAASSSVSRPGVDRLPIRDVHTCGVGSRPVALEHEIAVQRAHQRTGSGIRAAGFESATRSIGRPARGGYARRSRGAPPVGPWPRSRDAARDGCRRCGATCDGRSPPTERTVPAACACDSSQMRRLSTRGAAARETRRRAGSSWTGPNRAGREPCGRCSSTPKPAS